MNGINNKILTENSRGFTAVIALILIATGVMALSLASISSAYFYANSVNQREYRIQARLNVSACLDMATMIVAKDNFMNGATNIARLGCNISVANDFLGNISLNVSSEFHGIVVRGAREIRVDNNGLITVL